VTTRAYFYERRCGGGWRTARKDFTCAQFGCLKRIIAGETYFDTQEPVTWPITKRICAHCANQELKCPLKNYAVTEVACLSIPTRRHER
jgi:hypothetical protein